MRAKTKVISYIFYYEAVSDLNAVFEHCAFKMLYQVKGLRDLLCEVVILDTNGRH